MRRLGIAAAIVVALAHSAAATPLDDARKAVDASDYMAARTAVKAALEAGTASPDDLAEIYRLSGIVEAALGETDAAKDAFARWIALDPKAALPPLTSPKIVRPFSAAKRTKLAVKPETSAKPPYVTLVVDSDPLHLIAKARATFKVDGGPEQTREASGRDHIQIILPEAHRIDLRLAALDRYGNRVVELGSTEVPIVIVGEGGTAGPQVAVHKTETPHHTEPGSPRPLYLTWWLYGGAAVAIGGVATYFGLGARAAASDLDALNANSTQHSFDEAQALESKGRRDALLFNVGIGVAGALAITSAILYATEPRLETHVAAAPTPGGAAVVLGGRF